MVSFNSSIRANQLLPTIKLGSGTPHDPNRSSNPNLRETRYKIDLTDSNVEMSFNPESSQTVYKVPPHAIKAKLSDLPVGNPEGVEGKDSLPE